MSSRFSFKIPVVGDGAVGKTSLINAHVKQMFSLDYKPTLGANIVKQEINVPEKDTVVNLALWDIAGQSLFKPMRRIFLEGSDAVICVYDVTRRETFQNILDDWYKSVKKFMKKYRIGILVANKVDLEDKRVVSAEDGLEMTKKLKRFAYLETSALTLHNVKAAFEYISSNLLEKSKLY